jgi:hypothetical protein
MVVDHFADPNSSPDHFIPNYNVWELTAEVRFWNGRIRILPASKT